MATTGTATLTFSSGGDQFATVAVTGQGMIVSSSQVEAFMMGDITSDNNDVTHEFVPVRLSCGDIVGGVGFTIHASSELDLSGAFTVHWVWF